MNVFELQRRGIIRQIGDPVPEPTVPTAAAVNPLFARGRPDFDAYQGVPQEME